MYLKSIHFTFGYLHIFLNFPYVLIHPLLYFYYYVNLNSNLYVFLSIYTLVSENWQIRPLRDSNSALSHTTGTFFGANHILLVGGRQNFSTTVSGRTLAINVGIKSSL